MISCVKKQITKELALAALRLLARPLVRFCMKHSLSFQDLSETIKFLMAIESKQQLEELGERPSESRISVITGIRRAEVKRIISSDFSTIHKNEQSDVGNFAVRVIGAWQTSKHCLDANRKPRILTLDGARSEFYRLVESVSSDVSPRTVLLELERLGAVSISNNSVKLIAETYIPRGEPLKGIKILGDDLESLILAGTENVLDQVAVPNLHLRTCYDRVRADCIEQLRMWFLKEGQALHARARDEISKFDLDLNPDAHYQGHSVKVSFGTFSHTGLN